LVAKEKGSLQKWSFFDCVLFFESVAIFSNVLQYQQGD